MSNSTPQNNKHNTTESTKKMSNMTSQNKQTQYNREHKKDEHHDLFCGVVLLIFLVLSVVLCVFLWGPVAHLFNREH
jgi:hypothetical protein